MDNGLALSMTKLGLTVKVSSNKEEIVIKQTILSVERLRLFICGKQKFRLYEAVKSG